MTFRNNTAQYMLVVFYFTFSHLVSEQNKTNKRTKKKETEDVLSCLSRLCGLFALMGAQPETLAAGE